MLLTTEKEKKKRLPTDLPQLQNKKSQEVADLSKMNMTSTLGLSTHQKANLTAENSKQLLFKTNMNYDEE